MNWSMCTTCIIMGPGPANLFPNHTTKEFNTRIVALNRIVPPNMTMCTTSEWYYYLYHVLICVPLTSRVHLPYYCPVGRSCGMNLTRDWTSTCRPQFWSRHPLTKYYLSILQWIPLIILTEEVRGAQKDQWPSGSIIHVSMAVAHIVTRGAFGEHALLCVCISPFVGAVLLFLLTYKSIYTIFSQSICPYLKTQTSSLGVNLISLSFLEPFLPT